MPNPFEIKDCWTPDENLEAIDSLDNHFCVIPCSIPAVPTVPLSPDNWALQLPTFTPKSDPADVESKVVIVCLVDKAADFYGIAADDNQYAADIYFPDGAEVPASAGPNKGAIVTNVNQDPDAGCIPFCADKCFVGQITADLGGQWWAVEIAEDSVAQKYEPVLVKIVETKTGGGFYSGTLYSCAWGPIDDAVKLQIADTNPTGPVEQSGVSCECLVLNTAENGNDSHILVKDEFYMGFLVATVPAVGMDPGVTVVAVSIAYPIKFGLVDTVYADAESTSNPWANFPEDGFQSWCTINPSKADGTVIDNLRLLNIRLTHEPKLTDGGPYSGYLDVIPGDVIGYLAGDKSWGTSGVKFDGYIVPNTGSSAGAGGTKPVDLNGVFPVACTYKSGSFGDAATDAAMVYDIRLNLGALGLDALNVLGVDLAPKRARIPKITYELADDESNAAPGLACFSTGGSLILLDVLNERPLLEECSDSTP